MKLWYDKPAEKWEEALPLGNGFLGAMVYGTIDTEHIQVNEDSLWSGGAIERENPDCKKYLSQVKDLLKEGRHVEAERLAQFAMAGTPRSQRAYQTLGDIYLHFWNKEHTVKDYRRYLDLDLAETKVEYSASAAGETCTYQREIFISYPARVMVMRLTSSCSGKLNFHVLLDRRKNLDHVWSEDNKRIAIDGCNGNPGIGFCAMLQAESKDGNVSVIGEHLIVENASEAILYFTASTTFRVFYSEHTLVDKHRF
ncbi:hypothetical protein CE91St58_18140 [Lachnospiraceae bacterium]|nr:hypothetical protein CE91St56_29190 [Lachnospiraceae bacterium]GKH41865.1 hypothetical protein CE91St57_28390 [Lachnospiraceae bacterium]GKH54429.1 hypothetical protein CE91St58_18140 [Lachnospiraceae bacterium]